jgi:hypothetical protein
MALIFDSASFKLEEENMKTRNVSIFGLILCMSLLFIGVSWGKTLFAENFESDKIGDIAAKWDFSVALQEKLRL